MSKTVFYIKLVHSFLFLLIGISTIYVFFAAVFDHITPLVWVAFGVAITELLVLVVNDWRCPLTDLAERKGAEVGSVADLFLPEWLSERLFPLFGVVFFITCILLGWRLFV